MRRGYWTSVHWCTPLMTNIIFSISFSVITEVNLESKCEGTAGLKNVDIIWKPIHLKDFSNLTTYTVSYCDPMLDPCVGQYQLGCTLNTSHSFQHELLQCSMIAKDLFPFQFYFKVEMQTSDGVHFISRRKACRLLTNSKYVFSNYLMRPSIVQVYSSINWC